MSIRAVTVYNFFFMVYKLIIICIMYFSARKYGIGNWNAQCSKKAYIFCLACATTAHESTGAIFFTIVVGKWWAKLAIKVLVEYQVPHFEMANSFHFRVQ